MKVVIGLGNPGKKYDGTRHNVGFVALAEISRRQAAPRPKAKFDAEIAEVTVTAERVVLAAPQTYMNNSGRSVRQLVDFYQLQPSDLLVVCDDMNLPVGKIRLRRGGSAGGQKGLADILRHLGTEEVPRLRIGVSRPPDNRDAADYVLDRFSKAERATIDEMVTLAADAVDIWIARGIDAAMNKFNAADKSDPKEDQA